MGAASNSPCQRSRPTPRARSVATRKFAHATSVPAALRMPTARNRGSDPAARARTQPAIIGARMAARATSGAARSEEHTSELQSHSDLVCRLLLEKKKKKKKIMENMTTSIQSIEY